MIHRLLSTTPSALAGGSPAGAAGSVPSVAGRAAGEPVSGAVGVVGPVIRVLLVAALAALPMGCGGDGGSREFLSVGTGGTGGIYYPLGGALASSLSSADPGRTYTAEVSGGSVENVNRVAAGDVDLGFAISTTVRAAYRGEGLYEAPLEELRIAAPLYPNVAHVLVRGGLEVDDLSDLRDRPVSVGAAGSGTEQFSRHLLAAHGLDYESVDERFLSFTESSNALRDGAIDAAIFSVGYPASAVLEAVTQGGVRLLPVPEGALETLRGEHPYYQRAVLPAGTYPGLDDDVPTVAMMNWVVATEDLDDEVVTALLDVLADRRDALIQVNEIARQIDLAALEDAPIPLHPATLEWMDRRRGAGSTGQRRDVPPDGRDERPDRLGDVAGPGQ